MYWLIVLIGIAGQPDVKVEFQFDSELYCNAALKQVQKHTPKIIQNDVEWDINIKDLYCENRENKS